MIKRETKGEGRKKEEEKRNVAEEMHLLSMFMKAIRLINPIYETRVCFRSEESDQIRVRQTRRVGE